MCCRHSIKSSDGCVTTLQVAAIAYDNPIPGFQTNNTINLRLWAAKPGQEFDLEAFNTGDYVQVSASRSVFFWASWHIGIMQNMKCT